MNTIPLSNIDLALASLLVILDAVLSLVLRLKLPPWDNT